MRRDRTISTKIGIDSSKLADVTHTTLAKIESGININPTIRTLQKIAKALDVKVDDLIKS